VVELIIRLRHELAGAGHDVGLDTIPVPPSALPREHLLGNDQSPSDPSRCGL